MSISKLLLICISIALPTVSYGQKLFACGGNEIRTYELSKTGSRLLSTWKPDENSELPVRYQTSMLLKIDECKPIDGGRKVLATASTNAAILVDLASGKALWWAEIAMAHSAELLPRNKVVVAASVDKAGDKLVVYDLAKPEMPLFSTPLHGAHGVIWNAATGLLYALGLEELRTYRLIDWETAKPQLERVSAWEVPGNKGGHDLSRIPGSSDYIVTTNDAVFEFSPETGKFKPFLPLASLDHVKSVSLHPRTGQILYQRQEESWWAFHIRFKAPETVIDIPDLRLYKVRWLESAAQTPQK